MKRKQRGKQGEELAEKYLQKEGYQILKRNFTTRFGEIDLVGLEGKDLVFIEVKTRWSQKFGRPEEAVTPGKMAQIKKIGQYFKSLHPELPASLRIDVVSVLFSVQGQLPEIKVFKNIRF